MKESFFCMQYLQPEEVHKEVIEETYQETSAGAYQIYHQDQKSIQEIPPGRL